MFQTFIDKVKNTTTKQKIIGGVVGLIFVIIFFASCGSSDEAKIEKLKNSYFADIKNATIGQVLDNYKYCTAQHDWKSIQSENGQKYIYFKCTLTNEYLPTIPLYYGLKNIANTIQKDYETYFHEQIRPSFYVLFAEDSDNKIFLPISMAVVPLEISTNEILNLRPADSMNDIYNLYKTMIKQNLIFGNGNLHTIFQSKDVVENICKREQVILNRLSAIMLKYVVESLNFPYNYDGGSFGGISISNDMSTVTLKDVYVVNNISKSRKEEASIKEFTAPIKTGTVIGSRATPFQNYYPIINIDLPNDGINRIELNLGYYFDREKNNILIKPYFVSWLKRISK